MIRFVQHFSLLCCFFLLFLLQDDHLNAQPTALRAPDSQAYQDMETAVPIDGSIPDIHDIYGPVALPEPPPYGLYVILTSAAVMLSALIVFIYRRFGREEAAPFDPAATAGSELIQAKALLQHGKIGDYCDKVSFLLRNYIEHSSRCRITGFSSSEALEKLKREGCLSENKIDLLKQCFDICDTVKFSRFVPAPENIEALDLLARRLVTEEDTDKTGGVKS